MAQMFPEWLTPEQRQSNPKRSAEFQVYDALLRNLDQGWVVFYSAVWTWVEDTRHLGTREADFVIAHPDFGILLLEVKGGRISVQDGEWKSMDRHQNTWTIKNPYNQVAVAEISLSRRLNDERPNPFLGYRFSTAVCFPDCTFSNLNRYLGHDHIQVTIDGEQLEHLEPIIKRILQDRQGHYNNPGALRIQWLKQLLAPTWYVQAPRSLQVRRSEEEIKRLTSEQFQIMYELAPSLQRLFVTGCAGSGKTLVAIETVRQLVIRGQKRVLYLCYNRNLATWLRTSSLFIDNGKMMIANYHQLCVQLAQTANIPIPENVSQVSERYGVHFSALLPNLLLDAASQLDVQFDAIIVDEGQDFLENWWTSILLLLKNEGQLHVYYDDNQTLWGPTRAIPATILGETKPMVLSKNVRNTRSIHNLAMQAHPSKGKGYTSSLQSGLEPEFVPLANIQNQMQTVKRVVDRLINEDKIPSSDIAILTPLSIVLGNSMWKPDLTKLGKYLLVHSLNPSQNEIFCSSIGAAKGLEFPVVILTELYSPAIPQEIQDIKSQLYVGISRARSHIVIICSEEQFEALL